MARSSMDLSDLAISLWFSGLPWTSISSIGVVLADDGLIEVLSDITNGNDSCLMSTLD